MESCGLVRDGYGEGWRGRRTDSEQPRSPETAFNLSEHSTQPPSGGSCLTGDFLAEAGVGKPEPQEQDGQI